MRNVALFMLNGDASTAGVVIVEKYEFNSRGPRVIFWQSLRYRVRKRSVFVCHSKL